MIGRKAAMTLAEGAPDFKVDASIVFNNQRAKNGCILWTDATGEAAACFDKCCFPLSKKAYIWTLNDQH